MGPEPFDAADYWEKRYSAGGNSGSGSEGALLRWKAQVVNEIIRRNGIRSALELGSGDGKFADLLDLESYFGYDVSNSAVGLANNLFRKNGFRSSTRLPRLFKKFDLAMSVDVIYHIVDDRKFDQHMSTLFKSSKSTVVIYSFPRPPSEDMREHIRFNDFQSWVNHRVSNWVLTSHIPNKLPFDENDQNKTSRSEFYIYQKRPLNK